MAQIQHVNVGIMGIKEFGHWYHCFSSTAVDCGSPPEPANSNVQSTTTTFGSSTIYSCESGYELSTGMATFTRQCLETEEWSGETPSCDSELLNTSRYQT